MGVIEDILKKRNELEQRRSRLLGKMEAAKASLSEIDKTLKEMGVDPSSIEEEITRLKEEREKKLNHLVSSLSVAETTLTSIEERIKEVT